MDGKQWIIGYFMAWKELLPLGTSNWNDDLIANQSHHQIVLLIMHC